MFRPSQYENLSFGYKNNFQKSNPDNGDINNTNIIVYR